MFNLLKLLAVLTLATHINAEPTDQLVIHPTCEGETFCTIKPDNYPQEEIDNLLIRRLPYLHRMKREVIEPAPARPDGNCGVTDSMMITPFTLNRVNDMPQLIVQSKFFEQTIPQVFCKQEHGDCFTSYTLTTQDRTGQCTKKKLTSILYVYNRKTQDLDAVSTTIDIDCVCVMKF